MHAATIRRPRGAVAQPGERCVRNAEVEGSIPFRSTNPISRNITKTALRRGFSCLISRDALKQDLDYPPIFRTPQSRDWTDPASAQGPVK